MPSFNRIEDRDRINAFIHRYGFATIVSQHDGAIMASHLPVLLDERANRLRSHMARANPQWQQFLPGTEVLCIFHGPHAYISPSWYVEQRTVPTWNYATVHVYGAATIVAEADELANIVRDTTDKYEAMMPVRWKIPLSQSEIGGMLRAVVGFSIAITRVEAKFKLGQNRSAADQAKMLQSLAAAPDCASRELADFIKEQSAGV